MVPGARQFLITTKAGKINCYILLNKNYQSSIAGIKFEQPGFDVIPLSRAEMAGAPSRSLNNYRDEFTTAS
jgi:hypothetical protein